MTSDHCKNHPRGTPFKRTCTASHLWCQMEPITKLTDVSYHVMITFDIVSLVTCSILSIHILTDLLRIIDVWLSERFVHIPGSLTIFDIFLFPLAFCPYFTSTATDNFYFTTSFSLHSRFFNIFILRNNPLCSFHKEFCVMMCSNVLMW
jgi:hypothetical protein